MHTHTLFLNIHLLPMKTNTCIQIFLFNPLPLLPNSKKLDSLKTVLQITMNPLCSFLFAMCN